MLIKSVILIEYKSSSFANMNAFWTEEKGQPI